MKHFFILLTLLTITLPVFSENRTVVTRNPLRNYYQPYNSYSSTFSDIGALEKYAFNKSYPRESSLQRLQRLEAETFGAVQNGDINARYENVRNAILSRPKQNYRTSLLRGLGNYFSGQMTGFTPPIGSSYNYPYATSFNPNYYNNSFNYVPYPTTYGNSAITEYTRGPFGGGYRINNFNTGSSSGIRILD